MDVDEEYEEENYVLANEGILSLITGRGERLPVFQMSEEQSTAYYAFTASCNQSERDLIEEDYAAEREEFNLENIVIPHHGCVGVFQPGWMEWWRYLRTTPFIQPVHHVLLHADHEITY